MKAGKKIAVLTLILAAGVMAYAWGQMSETQKKYQENNTAYEDIRDRVKMSRTVDFRTESQNDSQYDIPNIDIDIDTDMDTDTEESLESPAHVYIPNSGVDFEALASVSGDAVAWLYCPGTPIDYPVMRADDYSYYLTHLPDGRKNGGGSLFIDYNCAPDFSGPLTVIYGHHMKNGTMFGSLLKYKEQDYYKKYPVMYLYTEQGNYRIELLYGCVIGAGQWKEQAFIYAENLDSLLSYAADHTTFKSNINITEHAQSIYPEDKDRVIVLSTCSYEFDNARYIVIGILKEENQKK